MRPDKTRDTSPATVYAKIKRLIRERILSGEYAADGRIPSENGLVRDLGVSRMIENRALRELSAGGVLLRPGGNLPSARQGEVGPAGGDEHLQRHPCPRHMRRNRGSCGWSRPNRLSLQRLACHRTRQCFISSACIARMACRSSLRTVSLTRP
jgi:DNA-binding transcriptional MocR family regulator